MRSIVVFLAAVGLVVLGKIIDDQDAEMGGSILMAVGLVAMAVGWAQAIKED